MDILSFLLGRITVDGSGGGGGSDPVLIDKTINANGEYNASDDNADGYKKVTAQVPNSYSAGDEGKVVSSGALVSQTAHADVTPTTSDQTIDTTLNNSIKVIGDADLVAGNIKKDVQIFGIIGTYEGSGGSVPRIAKHIEFTPAETLTNVNRTSFTLENVPNCVIVVTPDVAPEPPAEGYVALCYCFIGTRNNHFIQYGHIVRPDGTIGSDNNMCSYDRAAHILRVGGQYGNFIAGKKYHIYQIEMETL